MEKDRIKIKKMTPGKMIVLGFAVMIGIGTILLMLPISVREDGNLSLMDALFTSTSAVCVTGLMVKDIYSTFSVFGQTVIALLIQIGGLGISSIGVFFILLAGKRVTLRERVMVKESLNLESLKGVVKLIRSIFLLTILFEIVGALLSFLVFCQGYPLKRAVGISIFHAISSFNNSGIDILGNGENLISYQNHVMLNMITAGMLLLSSMGFVVIMEVLHKRRFKKLSLHSKVVLSMTGILLMGGTLLLKIAQPDLGWLGAFFYSISARTAGFATYPLREFGNAALIIIVLLMFIGSSPGSAGGGIKTTTAYVLVKSSYSAARSKHCTAFRRKIPNETITKAYVVTLFSVMVMLVGIFLLSMIEGSRFTFEQLLFEVVSAGGTVGLSTGITGELSSLSQSVLILIMFTGRLGAFTIVSGWHRKKMSNISYSEESVIIG